MGGLTRDMAVVVPQRRAVYESNRGFSNKGVNETMESLAVARVCAALAEKS